MKRIFILVSFLLATSSFSELVLKEYNQGNFADCPFDTWQAKTISSNPHVDSEYIKTFYTEGKENIQNSKSIVAVLQDGDNYLGHAFFSMQENGYSRIALIGFEKVDGNPEMLASRMNTFYSMVASKYKIEKFCCWFPEEHLDGFLPSLDMCNFKEADLNIICEEVRNSSIFKQTTNKCFTKEIL